MHRIWSVLSAILLLSIVIACSLPSPSTPPPVNTQITPDILYTQAVETVIAQLTQAAVASAPTQPVAAYPTLVESAGTALPTVPPATAVPTAQPTATFTPGPTTTATANPSATMVPTDPKLSLGEATWSDTFDDSTNWALSRDKHSDMYIQNGDLVMVAFNADKWDSWALTWQRTENFYIEITGTSEKCSGLDRYGIMLRANTQATRGYLFGVSCDGKYSFRIWNGKKYTRLVDWTANNDILKGSNKTNRLGMKAEGDQFSLYVNGELLKKIKDDTYAAGYFGFFVGSAETPDYTARVSELNYWELP